MHARELLHLAANLAAHAPEIFEGGLQLDGARDYWVSAHQRNDQWNERLDQASGPVPPPLPTTRAVYHEILVTRPLAEVWQRVAAEGGSEALAGFARGVAQSHGQASRRALSLLVSGRVLPLDDALQIHRVRRQVGRLQELLVGSLPDHSVAPGVPGALGTVSAAQQQAATAALRVAVHSLVVSRAAAAHPRANRAVAEAILACLSPECFSCSGVLRRRPPAWRRAKVERQAKQPVPPAAQRTLPESSSRYRRS